MGANDRAVRDADERAVRDVVRAVVASQASHELPYFARLTRSGDSWVLWRLLRRRGREGPLGFGLGEMPALATSVLWIALNEAARDFGSAAGDGLFAGLRALLGRLLWHKPRSATIPPLTEEQRQKVREAVLTALRKRKLSERRADDIANAVYYELSAKSAPHGDTKAAPVPVKRPGVATAKAPAQQRLDERRMPTGTNARFDTRFVLVVVLAMVTSAKMVLEFMYSFTFTARQSAPLPWWLLAGWLLLVLVTAVFAFYADSWWKTRRSRVRPIREFDGQGHGFSISGEVLRLMSYAGVAATARCVVDVTSAARTATVLGSSRRPVLCLHLGLVAQRLERASEGRDDPEFAAVLLHEFAHIRYGDVTEARGTMAVWRSFLLVALIPYLVICTIGAVHGSVAGLTETAAAAVVQRDIVTSLVLACLGYLARSDVLRNLEIHADRAAVRSGAPNGHWPMVDRGVPSRTRRAARAFAELWRSHPSWVLRTRSLDDPAVLFRLPPLPVFLAGATAALIDGDFQYAVMAYGPGSTWIGSQWMRQGTGALSAALVTLIVGVGLWRLTAQGRQTGRAATGLRTGLWLGAGMIAGDLAAGQGTLDQLLPARPEILLLVLAVGAGYGWWTVRCANAWLARGRRPSAAVLVKWRRTLRRWAAAVGLAGGFLTLSWWFTWSAQALLGKPFHPIHVSGSWGWPVFVTLLSLLLGAAGFAVGRSLPPSQGSPSSHDDGVPSATAWHAFRHGYLNALALPWQRASSPTPTRRSAESDLAADLRDLLTRLGADDAQ